MWAAKRAAYRSNSAPRSGVKVGTPSNPTRKLAGIASSPCTSRATATPLASIASRTQSTSGLRSGEGACHSRLRLTPSALVRRCPRRVPSGFMLGTTWILAFASSGAAAGPVNQSSAPSIHHSAIGSPGCWRATSHTGLGPAPRLSASIAWPSTERPSSRWVTPGHAAIRATSASCRSIG